MILTRIGRLLIVLGMTLILSSFVLSGSRGRSLQAHPNNYSVQFVVVISDFKLDISEHRNRPFRLLVLTEEDGLDLLANVSLNDTIPLLETENASEYYEYIEILTAGWYVIAITPSGNETITVDFSVSSTGPVRPLFNYGIVLTIGGVILIVSLRLRSINRKMERLETSQITTTEISGRTE
jgi:hypothetical protein